MKPVPSPQDWLPLAVAAAAGLAAAVDGHGGFHDACPKASAAVHL